MKLSFDELLLINGGTNATFINAIVKGISLLIDLGKSLGSVIRRVSCNEPCGV